MLYFDIFEHPITQAELKYFASSASDHTQFQFELNALVDRQMLFCVDGHYSVKPRVEQLIARRKAGEHMADSQREKAFKRAKFIGKFPYVKAAYISGSMSKGVMHEDGDVDFFVITQPGRLWVARTLLILYKKVFLFNSHRFFCLNYFIDSSNLEIEEKNLFTATETVTLQPIYDSGVYPAFKEANSWVTEFIPNHKAQTVIHNGKTSRPIGRAVERMLDNTLGDKLDHWFMSTTLKMWQRKFKDMNIENFDLALKTRKYVSKHHPRNFQDLVLNALDKKIASFEERHHLKLD